MKKILFLFCLFLTGNSIYAQDYLSGKLVDGRLGTTEIFYDRTQTLITNNIFQTAYKITDTNKNPLYTITLTHNQFKSVVLVSIKSEKSVPYGMTVAYKRDECGIIFSDENALDTVFNFAAHYGYLFSFTDIAREYPVLHKIKVQNNSELILDPLTKLRIRKQMEVVKKVFSEYGDIRPVSFNKPLFELRDSLYARHSFYSEKVSEIRKQIDNDVAAKIKNRQVEQGEKKYEGETRFGNPHGKGLLAANQNIYDGIFKEGKFVSGNVMQQNVGEEYCGEFSSNNRNGAGWLKYENGSYLLGTFNNGGLKGGIALQKSKDGEIYFGGFNGKRNGYGELQNNNGGKYAGQFSDDRLIKGYAKEVDPFGYYTYSRIENGTKTSVDSKTAEEFFGLALLSSR